MSSILSFFIHVTRARRAYSEADVVLPPGQSLNPSSRGTTSPGSAGHLAAPTWCLPPAKVLIFRREAPRRRDPTGLQ